MKKKLSVGITMLFSGVGAIVAGYNAGNIEMIGGGVAAVVVGAIIVLEAAGVFKKK